MIALRVECDVAGCPSAFTTDVTHEQGMEFGAYVHAGGRDVSIDGQVKLPEGWQAEGARGALTSEPFRVVCGAHS